MTRTQTPLWTDSSHYRAQTVGPIQLTEWLPESLPLTVQHLGRIADHSSSSDDVKIARSYSLLTSFRLVVLDYSSQQQLMSRACSTSTMSGY